jgi:hypothetical protein
MKLQDPSYSRVVVVTLAETTPVSEAAQLQADLRRARIEPYAWIINSSLAAAGSTDPCLKQRIGDMNGRYSYTCTNSVHSPRRRYRRRSHHCAIRRSPREAMRATKPFSSM